ncbi:MAG: hypothetical protein AB7E24_08080 [Novosphingobium sp.]
MHENALDRAGILILFAKGTRPDLVDVASLLDKADSGIPAHVTHRPDPAEGWLEVLASGLTFDLRGLSPSAPFPCDAMPHVYGFEEGQALDDLEAVQLVASGHIAAGAGLQPVVRMLVNLAANLVLNLPATAVAWPPARTMMEPRYFSRTAFNWLSGGVFPALGLTALETGANGSVTSAGLAHFIGQELQLEARDGESRVDAVKLAIRLVDYLVRQGPLIDRQTIDLGEGPLLAEPSPVGKRVWIWREEA